MNRRDFLRLMGLGAAAPLLVEPVRRMWFVPSSAPVGSRVERLEGVNGVSGGWYRPPLPRVVPYDGGIWDAETTAKLRAFRAALDQEEAWVSPPESGDIYSKYCGTLPGIQTQVGDPIGLDRGDGRFKPMWALSEEDRAKGHYATYTGPPVPGEMAARLEQATHEQNAVDRKVREIADALSRGGKTEALLAEYERTLRGMTHNALLKGPWIVQG